MGPLQGFTDEVWHLGEHVIVSQLSVVLQKLIDDVPDIWVVHMMDNSLNVGLHEVLNFRFVCHSLDPAGNPVALFGPDKSVASHLHAIVLGILYHAITITEVV